MMWKVLSVTKDTSPIGRNRNYVVAQEQGTGRMKSGYTDSPFFKAGQICGCEINDLKEK